MRPFTDAATRPSASSTTVLGIDRGVERAGEGQQRRAVRGVDRGVGHVVGRGRTRARCPAEASRMLSPTKATLVPELGGRLVEVGLLDPARRAPRRPDVDDHRLAAQVGEVDRGCRRGPRRRARRARRGRRPPPRPARPHRRCSPCRRCRTGRSSPPGRAGRPGTTRAGDTGRRASFRVDPPARRHRPRTEQIGRPPGSCRRPARSSAPASPGRRRRRREVSEHSVHWRLSGLVEVAALLQEEARRPDRAAGGRRRRPRGRAPRRGRRGPRPSSGRRSRRRARPTTA